MYTHLIIFLELLFLLLQPYCIVYGASSDSAQQFMNTCISALKGRIRVEHRRLYAIGYSSPLRSRLFFAPTLTASLKSGIACMNQTAEGTARMLIASVWRSGKNAGHTKLCQKYTVTTILLEVKLVIKRCLRLPSLLPARLSKCVHVRMKKSTAHRLGE